MSEALRLAELVDYHSPIDFDGHLKRAAAELRRLASVEQELEASQAEQLEQCRIIGMSAERELALRAELEALKRAISDAEPVAWYAEHQSGEWVLRETPTIPSTGIFTGNIEPLYTHPAQQAKPQPLLSSEIWDNDAIMGVNADAQLSYELIERFVRAIEAAHGIKGGAA